MYSALLALAAILPFTNAALGNYKVQLKGEYDRLNAAGTKFSNGNYMITNVKSGQSIYYTKNSRGHNLYPASKGSYMYFQAHNAGTNWIRINPADSPGNTKCASAQWGYTHCAGAGCDFASVLYACQVDPKTAGSTLEPYKQFWLFVPRGTTPESYNIVPVDHLTDMATRGWNACTRDTGAMSTCIDQLDYDDEAFAWFVTPSGQPIPLGPDTTNPVASSTVQATSTTKTSTTQTSTTAQATSTTAQATATQDSSVNVPVQDEDDQITDDDSSSGSSNGQTVTQLVTITAARATVTKVATKTVTKTVVRTVTARARQKTVDWSLANKHIQLPQPGSQADEETADFTFSDKSMNKLQIPSYWRWADPARIFG